MRFNNNRHSQGFLESVMFKSVVNVTEDPKINVWLTKLETEMKKSLAMYADEALVDIRALWEKTGAQDATKGFSADPQAIFDWFEKYPSQVGQLVLQCQWTEATETALDEVAATKSTEPLAKLLKGIDASLSTLAGQVLVEPSVLQRMKLEANITELVHQRTVLRALLARPTEDTLHRQHFAWLYYMRL
eukprot:SAG22_NODE_184_length_15968_cov_39.081858_5_plen_189_part_00